MRRTEMDYDLHVISLGAGVQSTTMLLQADRGDFDVRPDCAIFADTGWEPAYVYERVQKLHSMVTIPIYTVSAGNLRDELLKRCAGMRTTGVSANPPYFIRHSNNHIGRLFPRTCTREFKLTPIRRKIRELLGPHGKVACWIGISTDEAHRMKPTGLQWLTNIWPLIDHGISRQQCREFLSGVGLKPIKSSCIGCPYRDPSSWTRMKKNDSASWHNAVEVDTALRNLPLPNGTVYMHPLCVPIEDAVKLSEQQMSLFADQFGNECEGMCGV